MKAKAKLGLAFARRLKARPFTCSGCGAHKDPDGTPQNGPFIWKDADTGTPRKYCYTCDGKLIQDEPLPLPKWTRRRG